MDDPHLPARIPVTRFGPLAIVVYGLLSLLVVYAAYLVIHPFLTPLLLALVVVTLSYGLYERTAARLGGRRNLAASAMLLLITLVLAIPASLLILMLVEQAISLFQTLQEADFQKFFATLHVERRLAAIQRWVPWLHLEQVRLDDVVRKVVERLPALVATHGSRILAGFFGIFMGFLLMLLASFVFYTNGGAMLREIRALSPLPDEYDEQIFAKFRGVVDATFRGQFLTAIAQGLVTAIGLAIAGVPAPVFWGCHRSGLLAHPDGRRRRDLDSRVDLPDLHGVAGRGRLVAADLHDRVGDARRLARR